MESHIISNRMVFVVSLEHFKTFRRTVRTFITIRLLSGDHPAANPSPPLPLCPAAGQRGRGGEGLAEVQLPHIFQDGVSPFASVCIENNAALQLHFSACYPPKFIREGEVTGPQSEWRCRLWLSGRLVWLKANSSGNKRNPSDKSTVHDKQPSRLSAVSTFMFCFNLPSSTPTPGRSRSRWKFTDSDSDSGQNYRLPQTPTPTPQPWL